MAKPPANRPVLFNVESDSSSIKPFKDDNYKVLMDGVEKVDWVTDNCGGGNWGCRGVAKSGHLSVEKYADNFKNYYGKDDIVEVRATKAFTSGWFRGKIKFTIFDCKYKKKDNQLIYKIRPVNKQHADRITDIKTQTLNESTVHSTQRTRWRPGWMPNGVRLNFRDTDLRDADLRGADLFQAFMEDADLRNADLRGATTGFDTNLRRADLRDADLRGADLSDAFLKSADLRNADLEGVTFSSSTNLTRADFEGARNFTPSTDWWDSPFFNNTICPDGSTTNGRQPCSGDQLIPLA